MPWPSLLHHRFQSFAILAFPAHILLSKAPSCLDVSPTLGLLPHRGFAGPLVEYLGHLSVCFGSILNMLTIYARNLQMFDMTCAVYGLSNPSVYDASRSLIRSMRTLVESLKFSIIVCFSSSVLLSFSERYLISLLWLSMICIISPCCQINPSKRQNIEQKNENLIFRCASIS